MNRSSVEPANGAQLPHSAYARYQSEIEYFDREAATLQLASAGIDDRVLRRFSTQSRRRFNKEYRLRALQPIAGKSILEIGCGDGESAVLLAKLGARVTGVDISPGSIDVARARAERAGVQNARFICAPLTAVDFEANSFDAVWGDGILHHVIDDLDAVLERVVRWTKPQGEVILAEPVTFWPRLRQFRLKLPIPTEGTPNERPLERAELERIRAHVADLRVRPFLLFGRAIKFLLPSTGYEYASLPRRALVNAICATDFVLLSLPWLTPLAGACVMYGRVQK